MIIKKASTESAFRQYVKSKYADIVILTEPVETMEPLTIDRPVILMCDPVALWMYGYYAPDNSTEHSAMYVNSHSVNFSKFTLVAKPKPLTGVKSVDGLISGIKFQQINGPVSVNQCLIDGFNYTGIWAFDSEKTTVSDSSIIGCDIEDYYNYGPWLGGRGGRTGQNLFMTGCTVTKVRHAIGASYHPNNYFASGNTVNTLKHAFDRHGENGFGGGISSITGNIFVNPNKYAFSVMPPYSGGSVTFSGNRLYRDPSKPIGEVSGNPVMSDYQTENIKLFGNIFLPS